MSDGSRRLVVPPAPRTLVGIEPPLRVVAEQAAVHAAVAERTAARAEDEAEDARAAAFDAIHRIEAKQAEDGKRIESIEQSYLTEIVPTFHTIKGHLEQLDERIGRPPTHLDLSRISQIGDRTPEEISRLEAEAAKATGVHAWIYGLALHDARVAHDAAVAAGTAAGEAAGKTAAKTATRRAGVVVGSISSVALALNASSDVWGPPVKALLKILLHIAFGA